MTPLLTILGWLAAGAMAVGDRVRRAVGARARDEQPAIAGPTHPTQERDTQIARRAAGSVVAQLEDHGPPAARQQDREESGDAQPDQLGPAAARLIGGPRIDTASWVIRAGPLGFKCWRELVGAAQRGRGVVEWPDPWGEVVTLALERGAPGSGAFVLHTGRVRFEIRRSWAEVQITSEAAEIEGVESWYLREMPRAVCWLLGEDITIDGRRAVTVLATAHAGMLTAPEPNRDAAWRVYLPKICAELGVEQRRIELCLDVAGWQLRAGDERALVSRAAITAHWRDADGGLDGVTAGQRAKTPNSLGIYDKVAKLGSQRGPTGEALLERWREHGWQAGEPVTRIELRLWGDALRMVGEDGQQIDATHPGAALDAELLGKLWADGLTRHRMVDTSVQRKRTRDCPDLDVWARARAAGGQVEAVRLRRDVAARQLDAVRRHALARLGRVGAEVETLLEGDGTGAALLDALDKLLSEPAWDQDIARARARFADLLEQGKGGEQ